MRLVLQRHPGDTERTLGTLTVGDATFATIERPWLPTHQHKGGTNRASCVPCGTYRVIPHHSVNFPLTYALVNHDLDVFYQPGDTAGRPGRVAILMHVGNRVRDVIGCIAVGKEHGTLGGEPAVLRSTLAMCELDKILNRGTHELVIQ